MSSHDVIQTQPDAQENHRILREIRDTFLQVLQFIGIAALFGIGLLVPWQVGMELVGYSEFGRVAVAVISIACMFALPMAVLSLPEFIQNHHARHPWVHG